VQGGQHVRLLRQQLIRELRQTLGTESVRRSGDLVRNFVSDPSEQAATVDRFLGELDEMAPSTAVLEDTVTAKLRAASRDGLTSVVEKFDEVTADLDVTGLTRLADQVASVARLLDRETVLARHLAEPSSDAAPKLRLVETVLSGKVSDPTLRGYVAGAPDMFAKQVTDIEARIALAMDTRKEHDKTAAEASDPAIKDLHVGLAALESERITAMQVELGSLGVIHDAPCTSKIRGFNSKGEQSFDTLPAVDG
jgi:hypothetical protein